MDDYLENLVSLERLSNARRPQAQPVDQLLEDSLAKVQKYLAAPVEEDVLVEDASKAHRQWLMRTWNEYFNKRKVDPDTIWCGLCLGDPLATAWSKAFLSDRVENSVRRVMVIGPEEYEERRMLNCASSVLAAWRALIKEADLTVLHEKRLQEPNSGDKWRLRFHNYNAKPPSSSISVFEISKWIWSDLAAEHGLAKEITFEKLEATAEDVIIILRTLWERAAELGIDVQTRIAFHANVLLSAMGGFRPGTLGKVRYRDILVSVLRDPTDKTRLKHTATVTIPRNKLKNSLRVKNKSIKFSAFFVPFPLVCLSRLIVARAIQDDAFDAGYANAEEFLNRPVLGNVDYIPLPWKKKVLDDFVFRLSYQQFNDVWYRVCIAAGFRQVPRLYSLRVGAGSRLDKDPLFSSALRNWVMSHTNTMFEAQYQTSRLREDLLQAAFGQRTGCDNTHLFAFLRNMSISRDQNAPVDLAPDDWAGFNNRKDVIRLEDAMEKVQAAKDQAISNNDKEEMATLTELLRLLRSRHRYLRHAWAKLKLLEIRRKYFEEADRARALGDEPPKVITTVSNRTAGIRALKSNAQTAGQIIQHVDRKWNVSSDDDDHGRYIDLLVAYGKGCSKADLDLWEDEYDNTEDDEDDDTDENDDYEKDEDRKYDIGAGEEEETWKCIICDSNFSSRKTLTSHFEKHKKAQYFNIKKPRRCPECRKDKKKKKEDCLVESGLLAWFNHLERFHGPYCLPYASADLKDVAKFPCPFSICNSKGKHKLFNSRGLTGHLSKSHAAEIDNRNKDKFKAEVRCAQCCSCKRCISQGAGHGVLVNGISEWKRHFAMFHADENRTLYQCFICQEVTRTPGGLKSHFWNLHEKREGYFEKPFSCPECVRGGTIDSPSIVGRKAWQEHVDKCHNGGAKEHKPDERTEALDTTSHYPCLICGHCYHGRAVLQEHLYLKHREVFEKQPFQCSQCIRQLDNINAWIHHTVREHQRSESSKACTIGSHDKRVSVSAVPISERRHMDQIKQLDEDSATAEIGLIYEARPGQGEDVIEFVDIEEPETRRNSSFATSSKSNKRKNTGVDDVTSSVGSELRPRQRLRYSISASAMGGKSEDVDDEPPIDPELIKLSGLVAIECTA